MTGLTLIECQRRHSEVLFIIIDNIVTLKGRSFIWFQNIFRMCTNLGRHMYDLWRYLVKECIAKSSCNPLKNEKPMMTIGLSVIYFLWC